ncbi:hypothetical protein BHE18_13395 [Rossellomorea aquimaris]|uniref:Uncharacterized protein n=1 Tax=Rossellomorea aquimaris TaxID=189382 RepID=A0A1J6VNK1_9BACI|nr:hypothetical protein BHE18_13395 [Rossellomorea aquimaris]
MIKGLLKPFLIQRIGSGRAILFSLLLKDIVNLKKKLGHGGPGVNKFLNTVAVPAVDWSGRRRLLREMWPM